MTPILKDLASSAAATVNTDSVVCQGEVTIEIPESYDGTTTVFDTAVGHIQKKDDAGGWTDLKDGNDNELISAPLARSLNVPGLEIRVQFVTVSGTTEIPRVFVWGNAGTPKAAV